MASKNADKIVEVEMTLRRLGVIGELVRGLSWPDVEETEPDLAGNALLKARAVVAATGRVAIADDTGLFVDALDGRPGIYAARYAGPDASYDDNVDKLLAELRGAGVRTAAFRTSVALVTPDSEVWVAEGRLEGAITESRRGSEGFGYDPVFEVDGRTLAEISAQEKARMSHRTRALEALGAAITAR